MSDPESPLSLWRVIEFVVAIAILLLIAGSWAYGVLSRAWFGS